MNALKDWGKAGTDRAFPMLFVSLEGGSEEREGDSPSWFNRQEAHVLHELVVDLMRACEAKGLAQEEVGIITRAVARARTRALTRARARARARALILALTLALALTLTLTSDPAPPRAPPLVGPHRAHQPVGRATRADRLQGAAWLGLGLGWG